MMCTNFGRAQWPRHHSPSMAAMACRCASRLSWPCGAYLQSCCVLSAATAEQGVSCSHMRAMMHTTCSSPLRSPSAKYISGKKPFSSHALKHALNTVTYRPHWAQGIRKNVEGHVSLCLPRLVHAQTLSMSLRAIVVPLRGCLTLRVVNKNWNQA